MSFNRNRAVELVFENRFETKGTLQIKRRADDSNEPSVVLTGEERFKFETYYVIKIFISSPNKVERSNFYK